MPLFYLCLGQLINSINIFFTPDGRVWKRQFRKKQSKTPPAGLPGLSKSVVSRTCRIAVSKNQNIQI
jgi:hypothetical protein